MLFKIKNKYYKLIYDQKVLSKVSYKLYSNSKFVLWFISHKYN